jgi:hypothetical protein
VTGVVMLAAVGVIILANKLPQGKTDATSIPCNDVLTQEFSEAVKAKALKDDTTDDVIAPVS